MTLAQGIVNATPEAEGEINGLSGVAAFFWLLAADFGIMVCVFFSAILRGDILIKLCLLDTAFR